MYINISPATAARDAQITIAENFASEWLRIN
jgi:hypothetical protein